MKIQLPLITLIKRAIKLTNDGFAKKSKIKRNKQKFKIILFCLLNPVFATKWFNLLETPEFSEIVKNRMRLYFKPFRVYMSSKWDKKRKLKVILDTYKFSKDNRVLSNIFHTKNQTTIAKFMLKDDIEAEFTIGYDERFRKEGEIVVFYKCEKLGGIISEAAFSFEEINSGNWVTRIGCVQGKRDRNNDNFTKYSQKLMHGLRPKSLMIFLIQEMAKNLGTISIYGASDGIQANNRKHAIHIKWLHAINFNYNNLWEEAGGQIMQDGWYLLPNQFVRKNMEDIKTNKRAEYKRRYELLDQISSKVTQYFKDNN